MPLPIVTFKLEQHHYDKLAALRLPGEASTHLAAKRLLIALLDATGNSPSASPDGLIDATIPHDSYLPPVSQNSIPVNQMVNLEENSVNHSIPSAVAVNPEVNQGSIPVNQSVNQCAEEARIYRQYYDAEIHYAYGRIGDLREGLLAYDAECDRLTREKLAIKSIASDIQRAADERLEYKQEQCKGLREGLLAYDAECDRLTGDKMALQLQVEDCQAAKSRIHSGYDALILEKCQLRGVIENLETQLAAASVEHQQLRDRITDTDLDAMADRVSQGLGYSADQLQMLFAKWMKTVSSAYASGAKRFLSDVASGVVSLDGETII